MLTGAQVWYVATVYPEHVSADEAAAEDGWRSLSRDDQSYWESAATVLQAAATVARPSGKQRPGSSASAQDGRVS